MTWHWHTWQDQPYLTTELLAPWPHGFFTAQSWPRLPEVLTEALAPTAVVYRAKQVHGDRVVGPSAFELDTGERPQADGVMSQGVGEALWVCSADCTPVLIGDRATGRAVAIHAGWRGTAQGIVPKAIAQLLAQGSRRQDLRVALGPAISGEVYQVGLNVALAVGESLGLEATEPPVGEGAALAVLDPLFQGQTPALLPDGEPGRVRLDVRQVLRRQLDQAGLEPSQVAIAPHCTYREPERFFSYRRTRQKQVQWSGIVSLGAELAPDVTAHG